MSKFIYFRCSTEKQDNERQLYTITNYLAGIGEEISDYQIFSDEGVSGSTSISERQTNEIVKQLKRDDIILVVEMSRMSRDFADRVKFIDYCDKIGAKIYNISKGRYVTLNTSDGGISDIIDSWQDAFFLRNNRAVTTQGVQKAKAAGKKFGRANERYIINEEIQKQGRVNAALKKNYNTITNFEFQSFCRILKRTFSVLQDSADSINTSGSLFMLNWMGKKKSVITDLTKEKLCSILQQMQDARLDNPVLFTKYDLTDQTYSCKLIRAKIHNTFSTISTYTRINNF